MTITSINQTTNRHLALGPEFAITMSDGTKFTMWAEWFWDLDREWNADPANRVGLQLDKEWIQEHKN